MLGGRYFLSAGALTVLGVMALNPGDLTGWGPSKAALPQGEPPPLTTPVLIEPRITGSLPSRTPPVVAVLPFHVLTGSVQDIFLVDRLTDDAIVTLSHAAELQVLSRNTAFASRGWAFDLLQFTDSSKGRYVVNVGIHFKGEHDVVELDLYDAESMRLLLDEQIELPHEQIGTVSGVVSRKVADALSLTMNSSAVRTRKWPQDAETAAALAEAWDMLWTEPESAAMHARAQQLMEDVLQTDPDSAMAMAGSSYAQLRLNALGQPSNLTTALDSAKQATVLDPEDPQAHYVLGYALRETGDLSGSRRAMETCLALNPNNASCLQGLAYVEVLSGRPAIALPLIETAIRLSPREPLLAEWRWLRGFTYAILGSFDKAAAEAEKIVDADPYSTTGYELLAVAEAGQGHEEQARAAVEKSRRWTGDRSMASLRLRYEALSSDRAYRSQVGTYLRHLARARVGTPPEYMPNGAARRS